MPDSDGGYDRIELDDPRVSTVPAASIITYCRTGDEVPWTEELRHLWTYSGTHLPALLRDIASRGIVHPVRIAIEPSDKPFWPKNRVVDGHHRIAAALALGLRVPYVTVLWDEDSPRPKG